MKEVYSFTVNKQEDVEKESTKKQKNKETGKMEEVKVTSTVKEDVPYRISIAQPTRRQVEDADMEFSVEMSRCIKKGILTKAMLAKKYSDTGGLLSEEDAMELTRLYAKLAEMQNKWLKIDIKKTKSSNDKKKGSELDEEMINLRKRIVDLESSYQALFNHTADIKAQNKSLLWYMINLTKIKKDEDEDDFYEFLFKGDTQEEKEDSYYEMEESEDSFYESLRSKLLSFLSFWYFSANATEEDFKSLEKDLEEDKL
jgi:hypothetical protein|tara:strand:- start:2157 stop:2924 length:768 start_codon:yes stop_codon:yes gene_type:complete